MNVPVLPLDDSIRLLADWVERLGSEHGYELGSRGKSGNRITIGNQDSFHIYAEIGDGDSDIQFFASDKKEQETVDRICAAAKEKVDARDFGGIVWYSTVFPEKKLAMSPYSPMSDLLLRLGNQTRILGWRRVGSNVLVEFVEKTAEQESTQGPQLLAPEATVNVHLAVPGPVAGEFSARITTSTIEPVAAICAFALGRQVEVPINVFPTKEEQIADLNKKRIDAKIPNLARKSTSLDIFDRFIPYKDQTSFLRVRAALVTNFVAMCQERDAVASILYVVAAEALTTPFAPWRNEKLTSRFIKFFDELMPDELDTIVNHGNFEQAFGLTRGNKTPRRIRLELLDAIYAQRSSLVHFGIQSTYSGVQGISEFESIRRGLLSDFVEAAILQFLEAPRESLIGHPGIEAAYQAQREEG
jgi:hypothetical protein